MRYPKFLAFNAAGGLAWGSVVVLLGYAAGASYATMEKTVGRGSALAVLAIALAALAVWRIRKHLAERRGQGAGHGGDENRRGPGVAGSGAHDRGEARS
jgi:membrane protein DedA with SNARE-associated domain